MNNKYYRSVKEMLHTTDVSQLYRNGYSNEIIDGIFSIVQSSKIDKQVIGVMLKINNTNNVQLREMIEVETQFLDNAIIVGICNKHVIHITERLYCILNGIHEIPKCKICNMPLKNFRINRSSAIHYDCCSVKCKANDPVNIEHRIKTYLSRSPEQKLKTKLQKEQTIEQRFGNKCFMKTKYFKQKQLDYIVANGGECNVSQIKAVRDKIDETNIKTYGSRCNLANKQQQELRKQTYLKKYGVDHPMKNEEFKKRFYDEFEKRHGVKYVYQTQQYIDIIHENQDNKKRQIIRQNEFVSPLFNLDSEKDLLCFKKQYWWQCLECGHSFASQIIGYNRNDGHITQCPFCKMNKHSSNHSFQEIELADFLRNAFPRMTILNGNMAINRHLISPYEIDIWIPEKRIGIEYNGSFWHSIEFLQKYKSNFDELKFLCLKKKLLCEQKNIHLIHLYEDEWSLNKDATKKFIVDLISRNYHFQFNNDKIILPYDKYPSFMNIDGYVLSYITQPELQTHYNEKHVAYHSYNCGNLVFKRLV